MNALFSWLLQNTFTIALLIPIVACASRLCRNRPAVQHVLWAVLLLKFVTPPVWCWPWPVQLYSASPPAIVARALSEWPSIRDERTAYSSDHIPSDAEASGESGSILPRSSLVASEAIRQSPSHPGGRILARFTLPFLSAVWLIGIAVCALRQAHRVARHASIVQRARQAPERLAREIEDVAMEVGLRPPVALVTRAVVSPFMWFFGRLRLIWPETMSGQDEIDRSRSVLAHELAHIRRGDHYMAWVELVAGLLWWWNPLFWLARRRVRESAELACDAIAISVCPGSRREYAEMLLTLSSDSGIRGLAPVLGIRTGTASAFERRLSMILSDGVSGKRPAWGLVAAGVLVLASLPGWSLAQKPADNVVETPRDTVVQNDSGNATKARLDQIESELKRLTRLIEEARRSTVKEPQRAQPAEEVPARWRRLPLVDKNPLFSSFNGTGMNYIVGIKENRAYLSAFDREGREIWSNRLTMPLWHDSPGEWVLKESSDQKTISLSWESIKGDRTTFVLDGASGITMLETIAARRAPRKEAGSQPLNVDDTMVERRSPASVADRLRALNSNGSDHRKTLDRLKKLDQTDEELSQSIFRSVLNRDATRDELAHAMKHMTTASSRESAIEDIFWVLVNSRENEARQNPLPQSK
jgi:beta-lactamase regulating signal transducer with metallopeptidase domain